MAGSGTGAPATPGDEGWREREWGGYDIPALLEVCCICARDVVMSGSRWSWYICEICRAVNSAIATATIGEHHPGNQVIPFGRHSLMNGIAIGPAALENDETTRESVKALVSFLESSRRIIDWRKEEGRRLVDRGGFGDQELVLLGDWMTTNPASLGASVEAFCGLVDGGRPQGHRVESPRSRARRSARVSRPNAYVTGSGPGRR
jgi:hypothetical protein